MSRYFDDELTHSGVKGMKWRKHKYRLVKDTNGKLRYVYDNDNTTTGVKSSKAQHVANNHKAKATGKRASWAPDKPYQSKVEYDQENQRHWLKERDKLRKQGEPSLISSPFRNESASKYHDEFYKDQQRNARRSMEGFETGLSERHNSPTLAGPGHRARAAESTARHKAAVNAQKEQSERRKRIRQAEANKEQIEKRKKAKRVANNYKAKATGKRSKWASDKPYQSKAEYDQRRQRLTLMNRDEMKEHGGYDTYGSSYFKKHTDGSRPYFSTSTETASQKSKRNYEDEKRWITREMEGFTNNNSKGRRSRAAESTARHKAAVKAQKKKKFTDTIDKGRKAVEEFFTPKKKKKR